MDERILKTPCYCSCCGQSSWYQMGTYYVKFQKISYAWFICSRCEKDVLKLFKGLAYFVNKRKIEKTYV